MECDNNKYLKNKQFDNNKNDIKQLTCNIHFMCVCIYEVNTAMASSIKMIRSSVCASVHVEKVYWVNVSIVGRSKEDKKIDFPYIHVYACVYICKGP